MKANDPRLLVQRYMSVDEHNNPRPKGVFVGFKDEMENVRTGFSRCNYCMGDKFDIENGIDHAISEAILPHTFLKDNKENQDLWDNYVAFMDRAKRYFSGCTCGHCQKMRREKKGVNVKKFKQEQKKNVPVSVPVPESETSKAGQTAKIETKLIEMIRSRAKALGIDVEPILSVISQLDSGKMDLSQVRGVGIADQAGHDYLKKFFPDLAKQIQVIPVPVNVANIAN